MVTRWPNPELPHLLRVATLLFYSECSPLQSEPTPLLQAYRFFLAGASGTVVSHPCRCSAMGLTSPSRNPTPNNLCCTPLARTRKLVPYVARLQNLPPCVSLRSQEEPAPAEPGPCSQQMHAAPSPPTPTCAPLLYGGRPRSQPDLSRVPCGGAKRPRDRAQTPGAARPPRVGRGPGRRTRARPRCGAAEVAAATPGSAGGPGARPEPTTSRLP